MAQKHKVRHAGPLNPQICGGKRSYPTKQQATLVKEEQELLTDGLKLSVYRCTACRSYHLTRRQADVTNYPEPRR